jgi:hypothetical protein
LKLQQHPCENLISRAENYLHHKSANRPFVINGSRNNVAAVIDAMINSERTEPCVGDTAIMVSGACNYVP